MGPNISAIGGGSVESGETLSSDRELVSLTGRSRPKLLFVPTASMDSEEYADCIRTEFEDRLDCDVDVLRLLGSDASSDVYQPKLAWADVVYVGGGNTKAMMGHWRKIGFDLAIRSYLHSGRPAGGLSAGAICWFRVGNSDWPQYEQIPGLLTARLDCLGIVDLVACPHTSRESFRIKEFSAMMRTESGIGIGLDDCCAIQIRGEEYRILASMEGAVAHMLSKRGDEVVITEMQPHSDFRELASLKRGVLS